MANTATEREDGQHAHDHSPHDHSQHKAEAAPCCGGDNGYVAPAATSNAKGRSFQVNGLDCAEEVSILTKVVGPKLGGVEHLAFDVINGRMTVLDSAGLISDDQIVKLVATTGMSARPWNAENASVDQAADLSKQK